MLPVKERGAAWWLTSPYVPLWWLYYTTAWSQGELRSFACQLCSAQLFAPPGNFGSALFVLKLVIKCVQSVRTELQWPVSALPHPGQLVPFSRNESWQENQELGARAEQINHRIMSASCWRLAMGSEPIPLTSEHSQCRSKGGERKIHSACGKRGSRGLTSSWCFLKQSPWRCRCTAVVCTSVIRFHFPLQTPGA